MGVLDPGKTLFGRSVSMVRDIRGRAGRGGQGHFLEEHGWGGRAQARRGGAHTPGGGPGPDLLAVLHQLLPQLLPLREQVWVLRVPDGLQRVQVGFLPSRRGRERAGLSEEPTGDRLGTGCRADGPLGTSVQGYPVPSQGKELLLCPVPAAQQDWEAGRTHLNCKGVQSPGP